MNSEINRTLYNLMAVFFGVFFIGALYFAFNYKKILNIMESSTEITATAADTNSNTGIIGESLKNNPQVKRVKPSEPINIPKKQSKKISPADQEENAFKSVDELVADFEEDTAEKNPDIMDTNIQANVKDTQTPAKNISSEALNNRPKKTLTQNNNNDNNALADSDILTEAEILAQDNEDIPQIGIKNSAPIAKKSKDKSLNNPANIDKKIFNTNPNTSPNLNPEFNSNSVPTSQPKTIEDEPISIIDPDDIEEGSIDYKKKPAKAKDFLNSGVSGNFGDSDAPEKIISNDNLTETIDISDPSGQMQQNPFEDASQDLDDAIFDSEDESENEDFDLSSIIDKKINKKLDNSQDKQNMQNDPIYELIGDQLSHPDNMFEISRNRAAEDKDIGILPQENLSTTPETYIPEADMTEEDTSSPVIKPDFVFHNKDIMGNEIANTDRPQLENSAENMSQAQSQAQSQKALPAQKNVQPSDKAKMQDFKAQKYACEFEHLIDTVNMKEVFKLSMFPETPSASPIVMKVVRNMELYKYLNMSLETIDNYPSEFTVLRHFCTKMRVNKSVSEGF